MQQPTSHHHHHTWGGWISNTVATAEAAFTSAFSTDQPVRSHTMHNLPPVAKATPLANHQQTCQTHHHHHHHHHEALPPLPRRASESGDGISAEQLNQLLDAFNIMFQQNGGPDCVSRVKQIGDVSLATMNNPVHLIEAVEKELNHAKQKLDQTLQRLDSVVRTKVNEIYSERTDASIAAEAVIQETKEYKVCKDMQRRNASLLRDCSRLLAVFATKICASILEAVEGDKHVSTWSERVERIASVSSRGIPELRIISNRFADTIGQGQTDKNGRNCRKDLAGVTGKVADAAVEHVVQCVALAVAAMQVEVAERAYQCCV